MTSSRMGRRYIDEAKGRVELVRLALENAISVASVLLLTEATLTEIPDPKGEPARHTGFPEE